MIGKNIGENKKPKNFTMFLTKTDKTTIAKLKHYTSKTLDLYFEDETDTLSFTLPYFIDINNELKKNPHIDKIKEKFMIKAKFDGEEKFQWFIINKISKVSDNSDDLRITCLSSEDQLAKRRLVDYEKTGVNCLMATDDVLKDTGWKSGYINPEFNLKYRSFDITQQTRLSSIREIADTFKAKVRFNTEEQTVNYYKEEELSKYKGFKIGYGKYIQNVEHEIDASEIITRLHVYGSDGLTINSVNPTGKTYIDDFSFYLYPFETDEKGNVTSHSDYMSDDLAKSLTTYNKKVSERKGDFKKYLDEKSEVQKDLTQEEAKLTQLESELQIILDEISINESIGNSTNSTKDKRNKKNKEIKSKKDEIETLKSKVDSIDDEIKELNEDIDLENNLTELEFLELQRYIHEDDWTDENQFDENDLYEAGLEEMQEINTPPINLTTNLVNFFEMMSESHNWDRFSLGDVIKVEHKPLGIDVKTTVTQISFNFDDKSIEITVSNTDKPISPLDKIVNAHYTIDKVETDYNKRKTNWKKIAYNYNIRNDRIEETPTKPNSTSISHKENDDSSVNLNLKWKYPDYSETDKKADNIDGFLIYLYHSDSDESYQFGSKESSETIVDTPHVSRTYTFPSVPANLHYTVGIRAYRRVDEDINRDGILMSDIVRFGMVSTFGGFTAFRNVQPLASSDSGINEDGSPSNPYQPSQSLNFKGLVNGVNITSGSEIPEAPSDEQIWFDKENGKWKIWDGEQWVSDKDFDRFKEEMEKHVEDMNNFSNELNKELKEANEELEKAMEELEEELKRIDEEVIPEVERAVEETEVPSSYDEPEEIPLSGMYWDMSQDPPRLMKWNDEEGKWGALAPTEDEIEDMMQKMREEAVVESKRYSKIDIIKTREKIRGELKDEIGDVNAKIEELEDMRDELFDQVEEIEKHVDELKESIGDDLTYISDLIEDLEDLSDELNDIAENIQSELGEFEGRIVSVEQNVDEIEGIISSTIESVERLDGEVEQQQSTIEQHAGLIESKVDSLTYQEDKEGIIESIEENKTSIKQTSEDIELKADKTAVDNLEETVSNNSASIQINSEAIKSKVDSKEYDKLEGRVSENTSEIEQAADQITQAVKRINKTEEDIVSAESKIEQNAEGIALAATKKEAELLENEIQSVSEKHAELVVDVEGITQEVSRVEEDLDGKITSNKTLIQTTADGINATIKDFQHEYDEDKTDILSNIEKNTTDIKVNSEAISARVTKEEFEDLEVGGRNFLLNSDFREGKTHWKTWNSTPFDKESDIKNGLLVISGKELIQFGQTFRDLKESNIVTIRARGKGKVGSYWGGDGNHNDFEQVANEFKNYSFIREGNGNNNLILGVRDGEVEIDWVKLEKGNKATDWSPAPEDTQSQIDSATERITKTEATLDIHADSIEAKAEKSELTNYVTTQTYTNKVGQLDVSIDNITSSVSKIETDVDKNSGDITSARSRIAKVETDISGITSTVSDISSDVDSANKAISKVEQKADNITSTVSKIETDVSGLDGDMKSVKTDISQMPDKISLAVSEGIDGIEVGGRNLIPNADFTVSENVINLQPWESGTTIGLSSPVDFNAEFIRVQDLSPSDNDVIGFTNPNSNFFISEGETYTLSFLYITSAGARGNWYNYIMRDTGSNQSLGTSSIKTRKVGKAFGSYDVKKATVTFTANFTDEAYLLIGRRATIENTQTWIRIGELMLEKGSKATDWTPAPEDQVNKTNVLSSINLSKEDIKIEAEKVDIKGLVEFINKDGSSSTMIDGGRIVTSSITANELNINNIFGNSAVIGKIQSDSVKTASLDAGKITAGTLNAARIASSSITAAKIASNAVTAVKINANAVTADKIATNAIIASKISANAVTTVKIDARAITAAKIATGTITANEIASNAVTANKIAANAVTAGKISVSNLSALSANLGTVTAGTLRAVRLEGATGVFSGKIQAPQLTVEVQNKDQWIDGFGLRLQTAEWRASTSNPYEATGYIKFDTSDNGVYIYKEDNNGNQTNLGMDAFIVDAKNANFHGGLRVEEKIYTQNQFVSNSRSVTGGVALSSHDTHNNEYFHVLTAHNTSAYCVLYPQRYSGQDIFRIRSHNKRSSYQDDFRLNNYGEIISTPTSDNRVTWTGRVAIGSTTGRMGFVSSTRKLKLNIKNISSNPYDILNINPSSWYDKKNTENYADLLSKKHLGEPFDQEKFKEIEKIRRIPGLIAEEVYEAGLKEFVEYDDDGEINGVMYDRMWTLLIPVIKNQQNEIEDLKEENVVLKGRVEILENQMKQILND